MASPQDPSNPVDVYALMKDKLNELGNEFLTMLSEQEKDFPDLLSKFTNYEEGCTCLMGMYKESIPLVPSKDKEFAEFRNLTYTLMKGYLNELGNEYRTMLTEEKDFPDLLSKFTDYKEGCTHLMGMYKENLDMIVMSQCSRGDKFVGHQSRSIEPDSPFVELFLP